MRDESYSWTVHFKKRAEGRKRQIGQIQEAWFARIEHFKDALLIVHDNETSISSEMQ